MRGSGSPTEDKMCRGLSDDILYVAAIPPYSYETRDGSKGGNVFETLEADFCRKISKLARTDVISDTGSRLDRRDHDADVSICRCVSRKYDKPLGS